jgi:hypothetical protein
MKTLLAKAIFAFLLQTGEIVPTDSVDDRIIYTMTSHCIEYAYEGEIINYIQTGEFVYNEDFKD